MGSEKVGRPARTIRLDTSTRLKLEDRAKRRVMYRTDALRAGIVLLLAEGHTNIQVAEKVGVTAEMVCKWRKRFHEFGIAGLTSLPRKGRPPVRDYGEVDRRIEELSRTTHHGQPRRTMREIAEELKLSVSTIARRQKK